MTKAGVGTSDHMDFYTDPAGTPLGSSGAPSMPGDEPTGFGDPILEADAIKNAISFQALTAYSPSDPTGFLYDPRGPYAHSDNPADYYSGVGVGPRSLQEQYITGAPGDPVSNAGLPKNVPHEIRNKVNRELMANLNSGFSEKGVAMLAQSLEQYSPSMVEGLQFRAHKGLPKISNQYGFVTDTGGFPTTFLDQNVGRDVSPSFSQVADNLLTYSPSTVQAPDHNGVVTQNYDPQTNAYNAPGGARPGGLGAINTTDLVEIGYMEEGGIKVTEYVAPDTSALVYMRYEYPNGGEIWTDAKGVEITEKSKTGYILGGIGLAVFGIVGFGMVVKGLWG